MCYNVKKHKKRYEAIKAIELSNYVIYLCNRNNVEITNLKLQKILYYIQGYFFKTFQKEAFSEEIYCWRSGTAVPVSYYEYSIYGILPLAYSKSIIIKLDLQQKKLIKKVVGKCINLSTSELGHKNRQEEPWRNAKQGEKITKTDIARFFASANPLDINIKEWTDQI